MDRQLEPVEQDIRNVRERIVRYEQRLAKAEQAGNKEEERSLIDLLSSLQEEKNILLRHQAPKLQPTRTFEQMAAQLNDMHQDMLGRCSVDISDVNSTKWEHIRSASKLSVGTWTEEIKPMRTLKSEAQFQCFAWSEALEKSQAACYGPHIQRLISTPREIQWIDAANKSQLLGTAKSSFLPFTLKGTTNYAAVQRQTIRSGLPVTGLKVIFELKKTVISGTIYQAMVQLLAANIHTPSLQPVVMLTDLNVEWHILWMDGNKMWVYPSRSRMEAVAIVEDILWSKVPWSENKPESQVASADADCGGISRVLKRRRLQLEDEAAPCTRLTDLAGLLPADEYKAALLDSAVQEFCNIPAVAAMRTAPTSMYI